MCSKPGAWITPAMLDKIEEEQPLSLLNHTDAWFNWPARWKALRDLFERHTEGEQDDG